MNLKLFYFSYYVTINILSNIYRFMKLYVRNRSNRGIAHASPACLTATPNRVLYWLVLFFSWITGFFMFAWNGLRCKGRIQARDTSYESKKVTWYQVWKNRGRLKTSRIPKRKIVTHRFQWIPFQPEIILCIWIVLDHGRPPRKPVHFGPHYATGVVQVVYQKFFVLHDHLRIGALVVLRIRIHVAIPFWGQIWRGNINFTYEKR